MNDKGQTILFAFMLTVTIIVMAMGISFAVRQGSDNAMETGSSNMSCSTTTDDYVKAACYVTDVSPAFFIGSLIAIAGMILAARYIFGG